MARFSRLNRLRDYTTLLQRLPRTLSARPQKQSVTFLELAESDFIDGYRIYWAGQLTQCVKGSLMKRDAVAAMVALFSVLAVVPAFAQNSVVGLWKSVEDEKTTLIRVYEQDGKVMGKIEKVLKNNVEDTQARCTKCKDENKDKPMAGLQLIWDMEKDGNRWSGGKLLDPDSGRVVNCRLETDEGGKVLKVRGSVAFLSKTQSWSRLE